MDTELAVQCINWYAHLLKEKEQELLNIHFFGGEPFLPFTLAMEAVHAARIKAGELGMRPVFEAATNGVLSAENAAIIGDYIDFIMLSFDGPAEIQNAYRPGKKRAGSFDAVCRSARILSEGSGSFCLRCCITSETVKRMEEFAFWFSREFRPTSISFETLQASPESAAAGLSPPDPWEFGFNFIKSDSILEKAGVDTVYASSDISVNQRSFCPLGKDAVIVSPEGKLTGCYLFEKDWKKRRMDLNLGGVSSSGYVHISDDAVERLRKNDVLNKPRCKNCFCRWHCAGGCHVNHTYPGCQTEYDDLCVQTRIISLYKILKNLGRPDIFQDISRDKKSFRDVILKDSDNFLWEYKI
jgi:radical SAM protein with 4Fe4S-binding SPASM domain